MAVLKPEELVRSIEAVLFSYGKRVHIDEISRLCRARNSQDIVKEALTLLKQEYDEKQNALMVVQDGEFWKLTTRERFSHVVSKIVPHTEFSKTILETLAILAWKAPMRQSELIEIRTNKAYDHVTELVDSGFISKEKYGRTYLLKLTQKFFDYFDLKDVEDAHKAFEKILPEHEKKIIEEKIQAAKEIVDARELAEELPHAQAGKLTTKASLASELIEAAKNIKILKQPEVAGVSASETETKEEITEEAEESISEESGNDVEEKENDSGNDLEDDVVEEEIKKIEEEFPGTHLEEDEDKDLARPDEE